MVSPMELVNQYDANELRFFRDDDVGLRGLISIHDTRLGPAGGGTRRFAYDTERDAIEDVLRLSQAMTYKYALAEVNMGGAKAVLWVDDENQRSEELYRSYGRIVDSFDGRYVTGGDIGTDKECLRWIRMETDYVTGLPEQFDRDVERFFHAGGLGVIKAMKGCCELTYGTRSLTDRHVAVQGVGEMGESVVRYLKKQGATVTIADIDSEQVDRLEDEMGVHTGTPESIHSIECDVFVPAALGGVLNDETIPELRCDIVCGPANNQFEAEEENARLLSEHGVLHAPDFLASAGTIIEHTDLLRQGGYKHQRVLAYLDGITQRMLEIGREARQAHEPPQIVAKELAEDRIERVTNVNAPPMSAFPPE